MVRLGGTSATMRGKLAGKLLLLFLVETSASRCDEATTAQVAEGNFGQSGVFNWLGMLKVVSYENKKWITALTGIVLVKPKHVLANADDIVKIPQHVFERATKAMFVPAKGAEWAVPPKSYSTHPEYEYSTVNTIAIVELDVEDVNDFPLNPICLPSSSFNTSKYLYLTGFTDGGPRLWRRHFRPASVGDCNYVVAQTAVPDNSS
ncbi:uncharacterized protein LOC111364574 [Spodoptera litura]|uniref:Uncharacterized protein LOC111364574 n=1 Tax=Spodoptera litura TaxID=69820 RepID=A0A9J7EWJ9_SPOLT|nr:uncharacterized protein LOC111364574 [Spodoptera litura]